MATRSGIEWTETTWNPVTGCSPISPGCAHCYAERMAKRLQAMGVGKYRRGFDIAVHASALDQPLRWRQPRLVFVNSMSDLFHASVPAAFIESVFATMNRASRHTFQVLTKRPDRVLSLNDRLCWTPNIWLGVSIESERWLDRLAPLAGTGAPTKFLSLEPLLGPLPGLDLSGVDWVIAGGESGPGARPMHPAWIRAIRETCVSCRRLRGCGLPLRPGFGRAVRGEVGAWGDPSTGPVADSGGWPAGGRAGAGARCRRPACRSVAAGS